MKSFKVEVSKGLKKYSFIKKAENESSLKDELHREGFSILSITEIEDVSVSGNRYHFEVSGKDGVNKVGVIISDDIFKAYLKIKHELKYDLKYIYPANKDFTLEEKENIIRELEANYNLYLEESKKNRSEEKKTEPSRKIEVSKEDITDAFQMKKDLDYTYKIIDKVLYKLKNLIETNDSYVSFEKKNLLRNIYNEIVKIKNSTNVYKLKQIGELALSKIGELELEILENKKNDEYRNLLSETNKLLRQIGSKKSFTEKDKNLKNVFNNFLGEITGFTKSLKPKEKVKIDTTSIGYLKNKRLLKKYEARLSQLKKEKLNNFMIYLLPTKENLKKKLEFALKEKVIKQNISILKGRISGNVFSYVKIVKGYEYFFDKFLNFLIFFEKPILLVLFTYSSLFLLINLSNSLSVTNVDLNFSGMFYFIYFNIALVLIRYVKGILTFMLNVVIFIFLLIFGVINF